MLTALVGLIFIVFWLLHRRRVKKSKTYQAMLRAAEEYHVQCHAAIPNGPSAEHYTESWRVGALGDRSRGLAEAEPLSPLDLMRVIQLKVWSVNIVGWEPDFHRFPLI